LEAGVDVGVREVIKTMGVDCDVDMVYHLLLQSFFGKIANSVEKVWYPKKKNLLKT
jgi:hypothetical protein